MTRQEQEALFNQLKADIIQGCMQTIKINREINDLYVRFPAYRQHAIGIKETIEQAGESLKLFIALKPIQ